jgi:pimeloyl-ACP methyl ester carboxylesterase
MMDWRPLQLTAGLATACFAIFGLAGCAVVGGFQRKLMYFPYHQTEPDMLALARKLGCEPWKGADGTIIGWNTPNPGHRAENRLLVFHGNAGYALHRRHYLSGFQGIDGGRKWEVYLFEYPGYGARPGAMGQEEFVKAGLAALDALTAQDSRPVYLLGESLGSGVACALAKKAPDRVAGLFLVTPFARMSDVAAHHFRFLPVRLLLRDRWDNAGALRGFHGPVAMLIAGQDEVVTAAQGRLLFDGAKRLWVDPNAGHNSVDFSAGAHWWKEVSDFLLGGASPRLAPH